MTRNKGSEACDEAIDGRVGSARYKVVAGGNAGAFTFSAYEKIPPAEIGDWQSIGSAHWSAINFAEDDVKGSDDCGDIGDHVTPG